MSGLEHNNCAAQLRFLTDQTGLDMEVTESEPTRNYPEFPTQRMRCPHGVRFYALPTETEAARLRAMNEASR